MVPVKLWTAWSITGDGSASTAHRARLPVAIAYWGQVGCHSLPSRRSAANDGTRPLKSLEAEKSEDCVATAASRLPMVSTKGDLSEAARR